MRAIPLMVALSVYSTGLLAQSPPASGSENAGAKEAEAGQKDQGALAGKASGEPGSVKRAWVIAPRVTVQETITDNVSLGFGNKTSDQVTEVSPGIGIEGNTARLKLHLDYKLRELYYAQGSRGNASYNALNSFATLEAIENLFYVDMTGVISQQTISAFRTQSTGDYNINNNSTETSTFRLSPYFKGRFGGLADYEARYTRSMLRTKSSFVSDADIDEFSGKLSGNTPLALLTWMADADRQKNDYSLGRSTEGDRLRGFLSYQIHPEVKLSGSVGQESNDYISFQKQSWNTHGYGVDWTPTDRSKVSVFRETRFFGHGHKVELSQRFPLSMVKYTDTRDVSALPMRFSSIGLGTIYDLLYAQLASATIPVGMTRADYTNALLNAAGIPADTQVVSGFLSSQVSLQRHQDLTMLLRGARNIITLSYTRSQNDRLGTALGAADDFAAVSSIVQKGVGLTWSHQLSALSSLNVSGSRMRSVGSGSTVNPEYTRKMFSAGLTTSLGAKTKAALTARRVEADSSVTPYTENAVVGSISLEF